jgi:hypothetical protein
MLPEEIEKILENNIYYSGSIFDDGKQEYLDTLRKRYGFLNIQKLLTLKILNNHNWEICYNTKTAYLKSTTRCKDIDFIFYHQRGLRDFTLVHLDDNLYFASVNEDDELKYNRVEIHSKDLSSLLEFIHENNLKIKINKKSATTELQESINKTNAVLDFLDKV